MRIVFVRHGQPNYESDSLTELGKRQAQAAAERIRNENICEIYSSPLGRAMETAGFTGEMLNKPVQVLEFMREIHWHKKDGTRVPGYPWGAVRVIANDGYDLQEKNWTENRYFDEIECGGVANIQHEFDVWLSALGYIRVGDYYKCVKQNSKTVAIFSHAGASTAVFAHLMNLPFPYLCAVLGSEFTNVAVFNLADEPGDNLFAPHVEILNDARHIKSLDGE